MVDFEPDSTQVPPQVVERPTSVTVFGILNIVFGGLAFSCSPFAVFGFLMAGERMEMTAGYKTFLLLMNLVGFGSTIWMLVLGIGLLMLRKWARNGSVIFAYCGIMFIVISYGSRFLALYLGWLKLPQGIPQGILHELIGGTCAGLIWLIYPVLLLVLMQTAKVKQAFLAIGG
jgi:hypothetical protein